MEKMKMDTLYELLETGNFNENTDGALIWAIFELESSYSTIESKKIERLYELLETKNCNENTKSALRDSVYGFFIAHVQGGANKKDGFSSFYGSPVLSETVTKIVNQ